MHTGGALVFSQPQKHKTEDMRFYVTMSTKSLVVHAAYAHSKEHKMILQTYQIIIYDIAIELRIPTIMKRLLLHKFSHINVTQPCGTGQQRACRGLPSTWCPRDQNVGRRPLPAFICHLSLSLSRSLSLFNKLKQTPLLHDCSKKTLCAEAPKPNSQLQKAIATRTICRQLRVSKFRTRDVLGPCLLRS